MNVSKAIKTRKSTRKFLKKKPDWRDIIEAIHSTQYSPMAGKLFSLYFVIIDEKTIIEEIAKFSEQDFIKDADYIVVFVSNPDTTSSFGKPGKKFQHQEAGAAIQNFMLHLTEIGLSTCWIGHFNEEKIKKLLKIDEGYEIEALFPIGYSKEKQKENKPKGDLYSILTFNNWQNDRMKKQKFVEGRFFGRKIEEKNEKEN